MITIFKSNEFSAIETSPHISVTMICILWKSVIEERDFTRMGNMLHGLLILSSVETTSLEYEEIEFLREMMSNRSLWEEESNIHTNTKLRLVINNG